MWSFSPAGFSLWCNFREESKVTTVHGVQEIFFRLGKKVRWTGWILKPKLLIVCQSKFCVQSPRSGNRTISKPATEIPIEKGEPQKVQFSFCLVPSKLRFMNGTEDLSTLSHILSKVLSMTGVNNTENLQAAFKLIYCSRRQRLSQ